MPEIFDIKGWKNLSLRQKIGQTIVHMPNPEQEKKKFGSIQDFLDEYPVGGIFSLNREGDNFSSKILGRYLEYYEHSHVPLIQIDDMENGGGANIEDLTALPHQMTLGAVNDEELAYNYGKALAIEARCAGVRWVFAPVADLCMNPLNPLVNHRAISDNPNLTIRMLKNVVRGIQDHGVAASLKHFPGDGLDFRDQHLCTTRNILNEEEWYTYHGKVFKALIDEGVYAIMTGHIALPHFQPQEADGNYLPCTLSRELTTGLLKEKMKFEGVVVTDALVMGGFRGWYEDGQADIECFKAGSDILLWTTGEDYFDRMEKAINTGEIPMERLDDAVKRFWELKWKLGMFNKDFVPGKKLNNELSSFAQNTARECAEKSLTLLKNTNNLLPLNKENIKKVLIAGVANMDKNFDSLRVLKHAFEELGIQTDWQKNILYEHGGYKDIFTDDYDLIIFALVRYPHHPIGPLSFWGDEAESIWASLSHGREKTIVVSFGNPYYLNEYFERSAVFINAYSYVPASQQAFVQAIFGKIPFEGKTPVDLSLERFMR